MTEKDFEQRLANITNEIETSTNFLSMRVEEAIKLIKHYEQIILENNAEALLAARQEIKEKYRIQGEDDAEIPPYVRPFVDLGKLFSPKT